MQPFDTITVPTLLIDEAIARKNIQQMAQKAREQEVLFRPHFKTHQSLQIGEWFRQEGISKITVSSLRMASYFAQYGWRDITVAFPVNLREHVLINHLAETIQLGILAEDPAVIQQLTELIKAPLKIWLKIDAGYHRTGLDWKNQETILECAARIKENPQFKFMGLVSHAGNSYHTPKEKISDLFTESIQRLQIVQQTLQDAGHDRVLISVGDTPGCSLSTSFGGADEIRPGNFVYYDSQQLMIGSCTFEQIAAVVACPIVALHPDRQEVVLYGGAVHLSKDTVTVEDQSTYGLICYPEGESWSKPITGGYVKSLSQEHGIVFLPESAFSRCQIGDLLCVIPAHSCLAADLLGTAINTRGESIHMFQAAAS
jgi:D-serine deaminase-like pyridoxal phosphate-dependent protein